VSDYNNELNNLFSDWEKASENDGFTDFCRDGLLYKGMVDGYRHSGNESELWDNSIKKILFLFKDSNNNGKDDYRGWLPNNIINSVFFKTVALLLVGIDEIKENGIYPSFNEAFNKERLTKAYEEKVFAIVNCKKESGGGSISKDVLLKFAINYGQYLKKEIDILKPTIIYCGGKGSVISIVKNIIFPSIQFNQSNENIYFNSDRNILLIDGWHPSARSSYEKKYLSIMEALKKHLVKVHTGN